MTTVRRTKICGVHVSLFRYGANQWSFTIYGGKFTQSDYVNLFTYRECLRVAKLNIQLYHL